MPKAKIKERKVLVTGVFDLIHIEHIRFLHKAKKQGDLLIVGIETDDRTRKIKGHERQINSQSIRKEQLEALKAVDQVVILPEHFSSQEDWVSFMKDISPAVYAVSSNTSYLENKQYICNELGIKCKVVHEFNPDYSSTKIHQKLLSQP